MFQPDIETLPQNKRRDLQTERLSNFMVSSRAILWALMTLLFL